MFSRACSPISAHGIELCIGTLAVLALVGGTVSPSQRHVLLAVPRLCNKPHLQRLLNWGSTITRPPFYSKLHGLLSTPQLMAVKRISLRLQSCVITK